MARMPRSSRLASTLRRNAKRLSFAPLTYFAEEVRRQIIEKYGENDPILYEGGLSVRTSLDPNRCS